MAEPKDEAAEIEKHRTAYWGAVTGGVITIIGGFSLAMFGMAFVGGYIHDPKDILIPVGAATWAGSLLSIIGGFDAIMQRYYRRALVGSAMPAAFFIGGCVMALYGQVHEKWLVLPLLGMIYASGALLVATSRKAFFDGRPSPWDRDQDEWRRRVMNSLWVTLGLVAALIVSIIVVSKFMPDSMSATMCFLIPALTGMVVFLSYILWLRLFYWMKREE